MNKNGKLNEDVVSTRHSASSLESEKWNREIIKHMLLHSIRRDIYYDDMYFLVMRGKSRLISAYERRKL